MATWLANGTPGTSSATMAASTATGDTVVVLAYRDGSTAPPTVPAGWTTAATRTVAPSLVVAWRKKDASWSSIDIFTNASRCVTTTIRPASGKEVRHGANAVQGATSTAWTWAALTLQVTDGTSVLIRGSAGARPDIAPPTPTNHTLIDSSGTRPGFGTYRKNSSTDGATASITVSRSDVWSSCQVEFRDFTPANVGTAAATWSSNATASGVAPLAQAITQARYRFYDQGTESGSTPLGAQDTSIVGNLITGDGIGHLRVGLQSTSAADIPSTDDWQLQYERNASGTWVNVVNSVVDGYEDMSFVTLITTAANDRNGQSFTGNGSPLTRCAFQIQKGTSTSGTLQAYLYAHTGTFGSTSVGTGSPLATSTTIVNASTLPASFAWVYFDFSGAFTLVNGTRYVIVVGSSTAANHELAADASSTHPGNRCKENLGTWTSSGTIDMNFKVQTGGGVVAYDDPNLTDGAATTSRLTGGSASFDAGKISKDGLVDNVGFTGNDYTELLYSLQFLKSAFTDGDVVRLRVLKNGSTVAMTYGVTPTVSLIVPGAPKFATFTETFDSLSAWTTLNGTPVITDGKLQLASSPVVHAVGTTDQYDLNDSSVYVKVTPVPTLFNGRESKAVVTYLPAGGVDYVLAAVLDTGGSRILYIELYDNNVPSDNSPYPTYTSDMAWIRFRTVGTTVYVDTSPDASTWTNRFSKVVSASMVLRLKTVYLELHSRQPSAAPDDPQFAFFDNVNISAVSPSIGSAAATYSYVQTAVGKETPKGSSAATYSYAQTAVGKETAKGSGAATHTWTSTASGTAPATGGGTGSAAASYSYTQTAVGKETPKGAAAASYSYTQSAVGKEVAKGSAAATYVYTETATGKKISKGSAPSTYSYTQTAVGKWFPKGSAPATYLYTEIATGKRLPKGILLATFLFTETATGKKIQKGVASPTWTEVLTATGKETPKGSATVAHLWTSVAQGIKPTVGVKQGSALVAHAWTSTASGTKPTLVTKQGSAAFVHTWTETATGKRLPKGNITAPFLWSLASSGKRIAKSNVVISNVWVVTSVGKKFPQSTTSVVHIWTISSTGKKLQRGSISVVHLWVPSSTGKRIQKGSASISWVEVLTAHGIQPATVLNLADALYLGTRIVSAVYVGDIKVWPTV